jgi:isocitrate dehydrogenase (NAD+)
MSDGLFLESVREVAKKYPTVEFKEMIIDNTCMQVPASSSPALPGSIH